MANILCIESSGPVCSVALFKDDELLMLSEQKESNSHAELLAPFVDQILQSAELKVDAVAVSGGPGSYTGLRIGVSLAKGLCSGWQLPLIAISTLDAMVTGFIADNTPDNEIVLCPMIDARRMEVYCSIYNSNGEQLTPVSPVIVDDTFPGFIMHKKLRLFGDGAEKCREILNGREDIEIVKGFFPSARYLGLLAQERFKKQKFENMAYYEPYYLKEFRVTMPKDKL